MNDHDGIPLTIGDRVAFAARRGNGHEFRTGHITALRVKAGWIRDAVVIQSDRDAEVIRPAVEVLKIGPAPSA